MEETTSNHKYQVPENGLRCALCNEPWEHSNHVKEIRSHQDASRILEHNITAHIRLYRVGEDSECEVLPQALAVDKYELRAIAYMIRRATTEWKYAALNGYGWGWHANPLKAVANAKTHVPRGKKVKTKLYRCHPATVMHGDGSWSYPEGFPPEEVPE